MLKEECRLLMIQGTSNIMGFKTMKRWFRMGLALIMFKMTNFIKTRVFRDILHKDKALSPGIQDTVLPKQLVKYSLKISNKKT